MQNSLRGLELALKVSPENPPSLLEGGLRGRFQSLAEDPPKKIKVGEGAGEFIDEGMLGAMNLDKCTDASCKRTHPVLCLNPEELSGTGFGRGFLHRDRHANRNNLGGT
jgi:hypothetical protein